MTEQKTYITPQQVFAKDDARYLEIEVPEWGGWLKFKSFSAGELIDFIEENDGPAKKNAGVRLVILSLCDASGNRIGQLSTMDAWKAKDTRILNKIVDQLMDLNDMNAPVDVLKQMLADRKNASGEAQIGASPIA